MGDRLSSADLTEWAAFERVYGPLLVHERIDMGFAHVCWMLARLLGDGKRQWEVRDFMPSWFRDLTEEQEAERLGKMLAGLAAMGGG